MHGTGRNNPYFVCYSMLLLIALITSTMTSAIPIVGGFTPEEPVTEEVKKICIQVMSDMENKTGTSFKDYIPLLYRSQLVAGTNYLVKVCQENGGEEDKCVHVKIFQALPCYGGGLTVTAVQFPKTIMDPLVPF